MLKKLSCLKENYAMFLCSKEAIIILPVVTYYAHIKAM